MGSMHSTIRQFDVFRNPLRAARDSKPYLICIQHRIVGHLNSRVMAPLVTRSAVHAENRIYPAIKLEQKTLYFDPTDLMTLPVRLFGKPVANLEPDRDKIIAALDLVFTGI